MKYTDGQRVQKIYGNAVKLYGYITDNGITKEDLLKGFFLQWLVTTPLSNENSY